MRALIRLMSTENPLWGAPRIHGELLKLGFGIAQSSVAKYMVTGRKRFPANTVSGCWKEPSETSRCVAWSPSSPNVG